MQRNARLAGRTTAEYLRLYALEGFLLRLAHSPHRDQLVLKGGVLLAAYELRRPTTDINVAAVHLANNVDTIRDLIAEIAATTLPADLDDGLIFDIDHITAQVIRDEDQYSGVRVSLKTNLAKAREPFHVDVNVGDPIWPHPADIALPRLLDGEPIRLRGYPMEMVLAEKTVTALQRGLASTRWRDFADIYLLAGTYSFQTTDLRSAIEAVATHRSVPVTDLGAALDGYAEIGQARWAAWLRKLQLDSTLPVDFAEILAALEGFADPVLIGKLSADASWDPASRRWIQ
ncbi:nucleotidyl transferase AbiEii/AbiGii toxin family protein [Kutzneria sp. NPDC052558]|uniref:nucleotidyl transferase AbiEii/AbiGii toxin family protein n=1 Tax=Kutzneria sp. NPDC052558 TaxID=3364121 RepID=UPI0037C6F4F2